ncbi:MarR family winged helix-turn-helix transcriptional regulator [Actinoallomurus rhizosphaericola]|uniref:MarR family winged helix-turn-helix transcriptional regulator n=1 Tax=Actinoallomurus rhizosphaericola TaxID=2952536 RepID=UPI002091C8F8|nr:MarR family transcriptional regulator [Actinoallomurus rhizosphaericola]MCO5992684.1 MarR family transcriptional regulator [Actinoallomurus rhizosphaericola]
MTDPRTLAEHINRGLRDLVLMLRRASLGQPITTQQMAVLGSLEAGPRRMSDLAAEHGVRLPTMTRQIGRLLRDGLVVRGRNADDARVVTVELTPTGAERLLRARERRIDHLTERLMALSEDEREAIEAALPALAKLFADS